MENHHHGLHHNYHHPHPHEARLVDLMRLLLGAGHINTSDDLAETAFHFGAEDVAKLLREPVYANLPPVIALQKLDGDLNAIAFHRFTQLIQSCCDRKVGLILPLPPHVLDPFLRMAGVEILSPDGHQLPPHLASRESRAITERPMACRKLVAELDVIVVEVCRVGKALWTSLAASNLLDTRLVAAGSRLVAHLRPHQHPDDDALSPEIALRVQLL